MNKFKAGETVALHSDYINLNKRHLRRYYIFNITWFWGVDNNSCIVHNETLGAFGTLTGNLNKLYKNNKLNKKLYCGRIVEETEEWLIVK